MERGTHVRNTRYGRPEGLADRAYEDDDRKRKSHGGDERRTGEDRPRSRGIIRKMFDFLLDKDKGPQTDRPFSDTRTTTARQDESPNRLTRVTDNEGNEYLCPVGNLRESSFVSEDEKINCYDYDVVTSTKTD